MRSSAARLEQTGASLGIAVAVLLHAIVIVATLLTWSQHTLDISDETPMVPVDLVTIGPKTNIIASVKQQVVAPPKEEPVQAPTPTPAPPTPSAAQDESAPPETSPAPALQKAVPQPQPKTKPAQDQKKDKFDVNNILALLDKRTPSASAAPNARAANRTVKGFGEQTAMTADLSSALSSQVQQCWSPPVGAPDPRKLVVDFDLFLNQDGSIAQPPQLVGNSAAAAASDPYVRAAAEAARRAIYTCAPYKLPADRYSQWNEINPFHFDPRQMMGQ
jgi:type IV secretory pathway VirB10-like protein